MRGAATAAAVLLVALGGCGDAAPPRPPPPLQERPVRIVAVGDLFLGGDAEEELRREGPDHAFRHLAPLLAGGDLLLGNLEAPVTASQIPRFPQKAVNVRMEPAALSALADAGFDLLSLANNHVLDHGPEGLQDTTAALDAAGIRHVGAGRDLEEAIRGEVFEVAGVRIGVLGFMESYALYDDYAWYAAPGHPGVARLSRPVVRDALARLRPHVHVLVVTVHWGMDNADLMPTQRAWARRLADLGADLVVGHHPHVAQGILVEGGVPIVASLGNAAYGRDADFGGRDAVGRLGWVAEATIEDGRVAQVDLVPIVVDAAQVGGAPRPADPAVLPVLLARHRADGCVPLGIAGDRARWRR